VSASNPGPSTLASARQPAGAAFLPAAGRSNARRWTIVGLLFASSLINYLDRATLSVALPMISAELSIGPLHKGLLLYSFFASYALMQLPAGWLADRWDLRWFYAGMFTLWCLSCGLMGFAGSLLVLVALRIALGIGESIYLPGGTRIVSLLFAPEERGLPSGLFDCGTRAGLALGAPLIAWLILRAGWRAMFPLVGFSALVWIIPWVLVFPPRLQPPPSPLPGKEAKQRWSPARRPPCGLPGQAPYSSVDGLREQAGPELCATLESPRPTGGGLRLLTFNRDLLGLCLGFFCFGYYWYLLVTWLPDYLMQVHHLPVLKAGLYASLPYSVFGASEPVGGWIADRLVRRGWDETLARKGLVTVAFLMGLLLIPAARVEGSTQAILLVTAASLVGLATGNLLVILQACAPPGEVGAWTGVENFAGNLGGISALVTGFLISRTGSYFPGFALAAVVLVSGLLAYWFIVGKLVKSSDE
jgi:MFS family permease